MRGEEFLDKLEGIDPAYIEAADQSPERAREERSSVGKKVAAACLCILLAGMGVWMYSLKTGKNGNSENDKTAASRIAIAMMGELAETKNVWKTNGGQEGIKTGEETTDIAQTSPGKKENDKKDSVQTPSDKEENDKADSVQTPSDKEENDRTDRVQTPPDKKENDRTDSVQTPPDEKGTGQDNAEENKNPAKEENTPETVPSETPQENLQRLCTLYGGTLLAGNLAIADAITSSIWLERAGEGDTDISDTSKWENLSLSAEYSDSALLLSCSFGAPGEEGKDAEPIDLVYYGSVPVEIYPDEDALGSFAYAYRASFEFQGVYYDLVSRSDDSKSLYRLLDEMLGASPELFSSVLGFEDYEVEIRSDSWFLYWHYYVETEEGRKCVAEAFGYAGTPRAYSVDLDGDGIPELVCNCEYGASGARRVYIYRNNNGVIEEGSFNEDFYRTEFTNIDTLVGANHISQVYDPKENVFVITNYAGDGSVRMVKFTGMEYFTFREFEHTE